MIDLNNKTILISRTDSIGDVVLTLPMCVWIKNNYPSSKIIFLGDTYTKPILECLPEIDEIMEWSVLNQMPDPNKVELLRSKKIDVCIHVFPRKEIASLARKAKIPTRVGTSHRAFHLLNCNVKLNFSRKNSDFHESQLNFELLKPFGLKSLPSLEEISVWMKSFKPVEVDLPDFLKESLSNSTKKVVLHPKSQGSALEWPIEKYAIVAGELLAQGYTVYYTGTEKDGVYIRTFIHHHENCRDTTGKLTLAQLIYFISKCDALIACSTGPLHIAGILSLKTIGLFSDQRPIHPGRWKALGENVKIVVAGKNQLNKIKTLNSIEQIESAKVIDALTEDEDLMLGF